MMKNVFFAFMALVLCSCVSLNKNDSRYIGTALDDNGIALAVNDALFKTDHTYFIDVNVTVFNGRVMLVGAVENEEARKDVLRKTRATEGVKSVLNYIEIKGHEQGKTGFSWVIHKKIAAKLVADKNIASNNFKVVVYRKIAYVIGEAHSKSERDAVLEIIKGTAGVLSVRDNILVK